MRRQPHAHPSRRADWRELGYIVAEGLVLLGIIATVGYAFLIFAAGHGEP
jgi:hypothetical protein